MPEIGQIISNYRIMEKSGAGGMAVVYRALDTTLKRNVAIKMLPPHLSASAELRQRFEREISAVRSCNEPPPGHLTRRFGAECSLFELSVNTRNMKGGNRQ